MKTSNKLLSVIIFILFIVNTNAQESAINILSKMDNTILAVKDKVADIEMEMVNLNNGKGNVKKAFMMQKGATKKIFRYTYPESDKGIATLTLPGEVYLYLPMFKKPKKITNMAQGNAFNKTDFSLSEATLIPYSKNFTASMVEAGELTYVLDLNPKHEIEEYSRLIVTVNKKHFYPEKIEFFDKKSKKVKEAVYKYKKINNYWLADVVTMTNLKKNHKTTIKMSNVKINQGLKDEDFTVEKLTPAKK